MTATTPKGQPLAAIHAGKSTLPVLTARRLPDGAVELSAGAAVVQRFDPWRSDLPTKTTRAVYVSNQWHRLVWPNPPKP